MTKNQKIFLLLNTAIALLALVLGYPIGGRVFILAIIPYLVYIVLKCKAIYMPALIIHSASETSAFTAIFIAFILLSIWKYKELINLKLGILFWALLGMMPIFVWLVWQRIINVGENPPVALSYIGYYLSFFAFFYGVLVAKTFTKPVLISILVILLFVYILYITDVIIFTRIIVAFTFIYISIIALFISNRNKNLFLLGTSVIATTSFFIKIEHSTFTILFVSIFSFLLTYLFFRHKTSFILKATGLLPFIIIFILLGYGIRNYLTVNINQVPEGIDIHNWQNFKNRITYKFYGDRAEYWAGGLNQILEHKHFLPIPDMPDLYANNRYGTEREVSFGSHTTFIELIRKYGIISGGVLSICLIYMVVISRKIFTCINLDPLFVPFFTMAFACTIILCLVGQYQIMPGYALLSLGVLGVAYRLHYNTKVI